MKMIKTVGIVGLGALGTMYASSPRHWGRTMWPYWPTAAASSVTAGRACGTTESRAT